MKPAPVGTIRVFNNGGNPYRAIKFTTEKGVRQWMAFARWWWLLNKGPIPEGFHVLHLNGDRMDDSPGNLTLGKPSDGRFLAYERDPEAERKWLANKSKATAAHNRERAAVRRATGYLKRAFYPVDHTTKTIYNRPQRNRWLVWRAMGYDVTHVSRGDGADAMALGWPGMPVTQAIILAVLADGPLFGDEVTRRVDQMRALRGINALRDPKSIVHVRARMRRDGLVTVQRRGRGSGLWAITPAAMAARTTWTPIVPMRGEACRMLERSGYRKDDAPARNRVDASEAVMRLALAMGGAA